MPKSVNIANAFKPVRVPKLTPLGSAGYDNPRENIDPHIKTKVVSTKELTLSDGSVAGYVMNSASGVLSGGHAGGVGGDVSKVGTPVNDQVGVWTGDGTIEGDADLTFDGSNLSVGGNIVVGGTVDGVDIAGRDHAAVSLNASATTGGFSLATQEISARAATNAQTGYATAAHIAAIEANTSHAGDNSQAHSDYLLNSGADVAVGPLTITADNSTADQAYVPMILYNTDETPPAASGFPVGTLYVQYTA